MTGVLHTTADRLALQWFADRLFGPSDNPDSLRSSADAIQTVGLSGAACRAVDLRDVTPVACPTCGQPVEKELVHVS